MCKKTATLSRPINAVVEFWECEDHHMFVVDKKPPPKVPVAKAPVDAAPADSAAKAEPKADPKTESKTEPKPTA
jgi:hypothetical protein